MSITIPDSMPNKNNWSERTLRYWWKSNSFIHPEDVSADGHFYRVKYDQWKRVAMVDEYKHGDIHSRTTKFFWKWNRIAKTIDYSPAGDTTSIQIYRYGLLGNLLRVDRYASNGELIGSESSNL